jgi:predicted dehydrogenase
MDKVRFAIVGCGTVARRHHIPALVRNPKVEIGALCDVAAEEAHSLKERFRLKSECYTDLEEVLADRTVDVVDVCAPSFTHYEYARRSIGAGKHVLVEKPPVYRVDQAEHLISLSERRGVKLGVVLNQRYREVIEQVKEAEGRGLLGKIVKMQVNHHANLVFGESPWVWDERKSKYMLYEFGIHFIDLLVYFCGPHQEVLFVLPTSQESIHTVSDLQMIIRFEGGQLGIVDLTQDSTRHSAYFTQVNFYGTGMDAFARFFPPQVRLTAGIELPQKLLLAELSSAARFAWCLASGRFLTYRNRPHQRVLDMFVAWLTQGTPYPLTMATALPTIRLLNAIEERIPQYSCHARPVVNADEGPVT